MSTVSSDLSVSSAKPVQLRELRSSDAAEAARIHQRVFPRHTMSLLGPGFLKQYYSQIAESEGGLGFVATTEESILGLVAGTTLPEVWRRQFFQYGRVRMALLVLRATLRFPLQMVPKVWRKLTASAQKGPGTVVHGAELASLAVAPEARRLGVGRALVHRFMEEARRRGATGVYLGTRRSDEGAVEFYSSLGFTLSLERAEGKGDTAYLLQYTFPRAQDGLQKG